MEKKKIVTTFATGHTVIKIKARPPAREGGSAYEVEKLAKLQMVTIHGPLQNKVYMCIKKMSLTKYRTPIPGCLSIILKLVCHGVFHADVTD